PMPTLAPPEVQLDGVFIAPEVPFALYSIIDHRGTSALLTPIHRELVAADRPDLLYIHLNAKYAEERTTQRYHDVDKFFVGDLLIVTELGRIPETTSDNFVRKHEEATKEEKHRFWTIRKYSLVKRTVSHNVTAYMTKAKPRKPQRILYATDFTIPIKVPARLCNPPHDLPLETFYSATVFTPQVHPGSLLRTIGKGAPKNHVVRITAPVSVKHIHQPVLLKIDTLDGDRADLLEGYESASAIRTTRTVSRPRRKPKFMDTRHYTVTIHAVIPHPRGTIIKFYLQHPATRPTPTAWTRDTTFDIETAAAETYHCKVLSMDQAGNQLLISARSLSGSNLSFLLDQEVFMTQPPDYNLHDLWNFPAVNKPTRLCSIHPAYHYLPALFGGVPLEQPSTPVTPITTERGLELTDDQARFVAWYMDQSIPAFTCDASFGTGKTYTTTYATMKAALQHEEAKPLQLIFTPTNAAAHAAYSCFVEHDPLQKAPALRLISARNRSQIDPALRTEYDSPEVIGALFWKHVQEHDKRHPRGQVTDSLVLSALFYARSLYHGRCEPKELNNISLRRHFNVSKESFQPKPMGQCIREIHGTRILFGTTAAIIDSFARGDWKGFANQVKMVVVEEASQVPRHVFVNIANTFPWSRLVITGDPKQLPPFCTQDLPPKLRTLGVTSVLAASVTNGLLPNTELSRVFRCPPTLTRFLSTVFYGKRLEPRPEEPPSGLAHELGIGQEDGLYTIDLVSPETSSEQGHRNYAEADIAVALALRALNSRSFQSVGVICLYKDQCSLMASKLEATRAYTGTADASQGKEFDCTIVLTTRPKEPTPFACDASRVNVALSRAKKVLILTINHKAAEATRPWKAILSKQPARHSLTEDRIRTTLAIRRRTRAPSPPPPPAAEEIEDEPMDHD
uniref:AAA_12 domain-containing protein n=1 Tax=Caenorhabditis japonica TaxID=281687 RepID=A0A8R1IZ21_CAEJA